jgi:hypothetical protein
MSIHLVTGRRVPFPQTSSHEEFSELVDELSDSHNPCWVHHAFEPVLSDTPFIICFECGHVYNTAEELLRDEKDFWPEQPAGRKAEEVASCPWCIHDF